MNKKFEGMAMLVASARRHVDIEWAMSLPTFQYPVGMSAAWFLCFGNERGKQREALCDKALEVGAKYLFFMDDDTISPNYAVQQLHYQLNQHQDAGICGGIYCTKTPIPEPLVFQEIGAGPYWDWTVGDVFECKGLGTGSMMIKAEVLKSIPKPWFVDTQEAPVGEVETINGVEMPLSIRNGTDDLFFCDKVLKAGYKIIAHGGVLPVHVDGEGKHYVLPPDSQPCKRYEKQLEEAKASGKKHIVISA